jgi:3-methylfumaryl-CoA hydratase
MFAATEVRFSAPLELNRRAELAVTVTDIKQRTGRTGDLVLVELSRQLSQHGQEKLVEAQTLVYRNGGDRIAPIIASAPTSRPTWQPNTVELFRFSAATFNSHRIHYDVQYTRDTEGYPDLVVHGPLVAARLCGFAQSLGAERLKFFSYRGNAPLFVNQPIELRRGQDAGSFEAVRCDGVIAATARAQL